MIFQKSRFFLWAGLAAAFAGCGGLKSGSDPIFGPPSSGEISESGFVKPTLYYFASINEDNISCSQKVSMAVERSSLKVCPQTLRTCAQEGSCAITKGGRTRSFNVTSAQGGSAHFVEIGSGSACEYGFGVGNSCLDPFFSLAADLDLYKPGDVIFIPAVVGVVLPNGQRHHGFFVVRDRGGGIHGKGRFDFFSGDISWRSAQNPFSKLGLQSVSTRVPYFKIRGSRAQAIRESRGYPGLP